MDRVKRQVTTLAKSKYARFGFVGVINTLVDFSIFNTLVIVVGFPIIFANVIAATSAMIVSFVLNKKTVFRSKGGSRIQIALFFGFTLAGIWVIQNGVITLIYPLLGSLPPVFKLNLVKVFAVIISLLWNYTCYSQVVFNERRNTIPAKILTFFEKHWAKTIIATVIAAILLGILMGVGRSIWFDENYSIILAQRPVHEMVELTKVDAHPPLYYLYLKAWGSTFGWSEFALRLSSIIPSALTIAVMAAIIRRLFNARVAIVTIPFLVMAPFLVRYGYEIRMYAPVLFLGVAATYALVRAHESDSGKWWLVYAAFVTTGMYTLYMSIALWIGHALWLIYTDISQKRNPIMGKHWLYYFIVAILFLPWLPTVLYQLQNSALPPYTEAVDISVFTNLTMLLISYTPVWNGDVVATTGVIIVISLLTAVLLHVRRHASKKQWNAIMLFIIMFFSAVFFYWAISTPPNPPRFVERYMLHIAIFFYALVGITAAVAYQMKFKRQAVALAVVSLCVFAYGLSSLAVVGNYNFQRLQPMYGNIVRAAVGCDDDTAIITSGAYGYIDMGYEFQDCDFKYYQPVDLTYEGGYAPLNKLSTTKRVRQINDVTAKKVAFIYYDDSTEFLTFDSRYKLEKTLNYTGLHVVIYQRDS